MQQRLALLRAKRIEFGRQEHKLDRVKQVTFSRSIAADHGVRGGRKGMHFRLLPKGSKVADRYLFNVHGATVTSKQSQQRGVSQSQERERLLPY
mmetsp:Transcript_8534/g.15477  ORF Transcript_8534/g.15477 Transcript_8534/m.15477 type:complete len:94 (+) Transcript_8534:818-1099(+)